MPDRTTKSQPRSANEGDGPAPRVSVVIPTRNRRKLLPASLDSVWAQTYQDFEVIVVDDGSTDGTREYLESLDEPRLRTVFRPHRGISATANVGLRAARGELIARLDSDDLWLPDMLEAEIAALDARPDAGLVYARAQFIDADGQPKGRTTGLPLRFPGDSLASMLYEDCTTHCTVIVRRSVLDQVGVYDEDLPSNEDWDLWLRCARRFPFVFLDRVTALYRLHDGNMTSTRDAGAFADLLHIRQTVLDKFFAAPDAPASVRVMRPVAYGNFFVDCGVRFWAARQPINALRAFARALRADPRPWTLARILWFSLARSVLDRLPGGWRIVDWTANVRRRGVIEHS